MRSGVIYHLWSLKQKSLCYPLNMNKQIEPFVHTQVIVVIDQDEVCDAFHTQIDLAIPLSKLFVELLVSLPPVAAPFHDPGREKFQMRQKTLVVPVLFVQPDLKRLLHDIQDAGDQPGDCIR